MSDRMDEAIVQMDKDLGLAETVEETPVETIEEETPAVEEVSEQEEVVEETPEVEEPTAEEKLLAGKYHTPEELERAYEELQSRMGSQGAELGELRKLVEERLPEPDDQPAIQVNQGVVDWFDEQIDTVGAGAAATWAQENDPSGVLYNRAMDAWYEIQPRQAAAYERRQEYAQLTQQFEQQNQPLQKQAEQSLIAQAWNQAASEIPDLSDFADAIVVEAKDSPEILRDAHTLEQKVKAYRKLYRLAKSAQTETLETATAETQRAQAEADKAAKLSATSATQTKVQVPEKISEDEKWARDNLDPYLAQYEARD